ncbi:MAG: hypothetical protein JXR94_22715 [Candidatus Hydrogenedentes bacterium]|nr:hypothetical protein [Candidatus Hydrogenedentota bacterium]
MWNITNRQPMAIGLLAAVLMFGLPGRLWAVDTGGCECVNESEYFPGGKTTNLGSPPGVLGIMAPSSVCIGHYIYVSASGGGDCDIVKGPGSYCTYGLCGSGDDLPDCSSGNVRAHASNNVDKKYIWHASGAVGEPVLPTSDEEIDHIDCPDFNYDTDPWAWIKAPDTPGTVTITLSREGCEADEGDGNPASRQVSVNVVDSRAIRNRRFYCTQGGKEAQIRGYVDHTNEVLLNDDPIDGPWRQYDSDEDGDLDSEDEYRGGYDMAVCAKYVMQSYNDPFNSSPEVVSAMSSCWAGVEVAWIGGGDPWYVHPTDFVFHKEGMANPPTDWGDFLSQEDFEVLFVRYALQVVNPNATPPTVYDRGGGGACVINRAVLGLETYVVGNLVHEWGHNTGTTDPGSTHHGLGHVSLTATGDEYTNNVMGRTTSSRSWVSVTPLTTDSTVWCNAPVPPGKQAQYGAFLDED